MEIQFCLECNRVLKGRSDKKFCDQKCKNTHYNEYRRTRQPLRFKQINQILVHNRNILKTMFEKFPLKNISNDQLSREGFLFSYYTNSSPDTFYCYDYGFRHTSDGFLQLLKVNGKLSMSA